MITNRKFFRSNPVTPLTGEITITGGVAAGLYSNLSSALGYIGTFTGATTTSESLVGDVFKFTIPANTFFSLNTNFLSGQNVSFEDPNGLVTKFGGAAFAQNNATIVLGSVLFEGGAAFNASSGNITINDIMLNDPNDTFAPDFTGTMNIYGDIGPTTGSDYINFFSGNILGSIINTTTVNQTSNAGGLEGDLQSAVNNGASIYYTL